MSIGGSRLRGVQWWKAQRRGGSAGVAVCSRRGGWRWSRRAPDLPSDRLSSLAECRLIPLLIRTPVRLEWSHDQHGSRPRHRSGHRCRGARRSPGTAVPPPTPPRPTCSARPVAWADLHPAESIQDAALLSRHGDQPLAVAGPGAPLVAEFCVAEFAAAVGLPTETGKAYLGEALELRHRLPRTWARVGSGDLAAWRARRIARADHRLEPGGGGVRGRPGRAVRAPDPAQRGGPAGGGGDRPVHARGGPAPPGGRRGRPARPRAHRSGVLRGHRVGAGRGRPGRRPGPRHRPVGRRRPAGRPRLGRVAGRAPLRSARGDGPPPAVAGPRHQTDRHRPTAPPGPTPGRQVVLHVHVSEDAITGPAPVGRSCTWPGWRTPARSSTPTRSAPGAAAPAPG